MNLDKTLAKVEKVAAGWDRQASLINRSKCHDSERQLRKGMAIGARYAIEQVQAVMPAPPPGAGNDALESPDV